MSFLTTFFDELEKLAAKRSKKRYIYFGARLQPHGKNKISEREWREKRNLATVSGALGPGATIVSAAFGGAAPGRGIMSGLGSYLGQESGEVLSRSLAPSEKAHVLARLIGGAAGARLFHGRFPGKK